MKIYSLALCLVLAGSTSAFVPHHQSAKPPSTSLQAQKNDWVGPAAAAVAGWAMAAQLAFATPADPVTILPGKSEMLTRDGRAPKTLPGSKRVAQL